jgi:hypothetical protein
LMDESATSLPITNTETIALGRHLRRLRNRCVGQVGSMESGNMARASRHFGQNQGAFGSLVTAPATVRRAAKGSRLSDPLSPLLREALRG